MRIRHVKGAEEYIAQSPLVIGSPEAYCGRWKKDVFGTDAPLYLEVGMGMGRFIRTHALQHPDISYIGFEINSTVLYKALCRYEKEREAEKERLSAAAGKTSEAAFGGLSAAERSERGNLRFIRQDARFLSDDFAEGEVDRIYLNFSDPWPKDKNVNKRLTSPNFLRLYDKILKPDGVIEFKTDNEALFDYSLSVIPEAGWRLTLVTRDLHGDPALSAGNVMTEYEEKFSKKGNPIYKLAAAR